MVQLRTAIANAERNRTTALKLADQAGKENNPLQVRVKSKTASIYGRSTMTYQELLAKLEVMYRVLNKYHDIAKSNIEVMTVELQESTMRHSAARAVGAAMKGFWSIMSTGQDKEMYDLAKEHIAEEWDNTVGEMENFVAISKDVVSSFDLDQGVLEEDGLKHLAEWEQRADSQVLGAEKQGVGLRTTPVRTEKISNASSEPITVCVVTWPGYAGGEYFNGGFAASTDSRYYRDYGIKVAFKVIEQFVPSREAWKADKCQVIWQTADAFPTEVAGLKEYQPKIIFQADWSRGGDVVIARHG